jgi:hypothetical protein
MLDELIASPCFFFVYIVKALRNVLLNSKKSALAELYGKCPDTRLQPTNAVINSIKYLGQAYIDDYGEVKRLTEHNEMSLLEAIAEVNSKADTATCSPTLVAQPSPILNGLNCHEDELILFRLLLNDIELFLEKWSRLEINLATNVCLNEDFDSLGEDFEEPEYDSSDADILGKLKPKITVDNAIPIVLTPVLVPEPNTPVIATTSPSALSTVATSVASSTYVSVSAISPQEKLSDSEAPYRKTKLKLLFINDDDEDEDENDYPKQLKSSHDERIVLSSAQQNNIQPQPQQQPQPQPQQQNDEQQNMKQTKKTRRSKRKSDELVTVWQRFEDDVSFSFCRLDGKLFIDLFCFILIQDSTVVIEKAFEKKAELTYALDPYKRILRKSLVDVTPNTCHLSEEAIDVFIRIVVDNANKQHNSLKVFAHITTQAMPLFRQHGQQSLFGKKRSNSGTPREGTIMDKPLQVDTSPASPPSLFRPLHYDDHIVFPPGL